MVLCATDCHLAGRYRLCRWLAAGGMGQVWQAVDEVLGRPVAVKLLRDEYAQDPSFVRRFRAEARYAAAVAHPGIASVFDYGEVTTAEGAEPTAFLVMELVAGEPLSWLLAREGRLGLDRSLDIVGHAAVAVGAAQSEPPTGPVGITTGNNHQPTDRPPRPTSGLSGRDRLTTAAGRPLSGGAAASALLSRLDPHRSRQAYPSRPHPPPFSCDRVIVRCRDSRHGEPHNESVLIAAPGGVVAGPPSRHRPPRVPGQPHDLPHRTYSGG